MLGHTSLEMTRRYCELANIDVKRAHTTASPVDNLEITMRRPKASAGNPNQTARPPRCRGKLVGKDKADTTCHN